MDSISARLLATNFRRSSLPARKDTITVPSNGYTAVRFRADNPGETPPVLLEKDKTSNRIEVCLCLCVYMCVCVYIYIYIYHIYYIYHVYYIYVYIYNI